MYESSQPPKLADFSLFAENQNFKNIIGTYHSFVNPQALSQIKIIQRAKYLQYAPVGYMPVTQYWFNFFVY